MIVLLNVGELVCLLVVILAVAIVIPIVEVDANLDVKVNARTFVKIHQRNQAVSDIILPQEEILKNLQVEGLVNSLMPAMVIVWHHAQMIVLQLVEELVREDVAKVV